MRCKVGNLLRDTGCRDDRLPLFGREPNQHESLAILTHKVFSESAVKIIAITGSFGLVYRGFCKVAKVPSGCQRNIFQSNFDQLTCA